MTVGPVLVTAALGNVGSATAAALLAAGSEVRAGGRDPAAVARRFPDAEAVRLDFLDPATFRPALAGCRALFLLRPPPIARVKPTLNRLVDVAAGLGVEHVVFSSVQGADTNRIVPHHRVEQHILASGLAWTMLRPGFFAQNLTDAYRADIRDDHRLYVPAGQGRVAFVDVTDIGEVAARVFARPAAHAGQGYPLTGPEAVTFGQVAAMLTAALGRPVRYQPASVPGYLRHLRRRGLPLAQVAVQTILHTGLRRGDAETVDPAVERLLGRPATPLSAFIDRNLGRWSLPGGRRRQPLGDRLGGSLARAAREPAARRVLNPHGLAGGVARVLEGARLGDGGAGQGGDDALVVGRAGGAATMMIPSAAAVTVHH